MIFSGSPHKWLLVLSAISMPSGLDAKAAEETPVLPAYGEMLVRTLTTLTIMVVVLLVVAWALRWFLRRRMPGGGSEQIECLGRRTLEPGKNLYLIRVKSQDLLVGSGADGLRLIAEVKSHQEGQAFKDVLGADRKAPTEPPAT